MKMVNILLFLICTREAINAVKLQNTNYMSHGYDIGFSEILFRQAEDFIKPIRGEVFSLTYSKEIEYNGNIFNVPEETDVVSVPFGSFTTTVTNIKTMDDLKELTQSTLSFDVGGSFDWLSAGFGYSQTVKDLAQTINKNEELTFIGQCRLSTWQIEYSPFINPKLHPSFISGVKSITKEGIEKDYLKFLNYFGTHTIRKMLMGGVATQKNTLKYTYAKTLQEHGVDIKESAKVGFYVEANQQYSSSYDKTKFIEFEKNIVRDSYTTIGGDVKYSVKDYANWAPTVALNPVPISYTLSPLYELLNKENFPDDSDIEIKREILKQKTIDYLKGQFKCPNNCSGNGTCVKTIFDAIGICKCNQGFSPPDCASDQVSFDKYECSGAQNSSYQGDEQDDRYVSKVSVFDNFNVVYETCRSGVYKISPSDGSSEQASRDREDYKDYEFKCNPGEILNAFKKTFTTIIPQDCKSGGFLKEFCDAINQARKYNKYEIFLSCVKIKGMGFNQENCSYQTECPKYSISTGIRSIQGIPQLYCCQGRIPDPIFIN